MPNLENTKKRLEVYIKARGQLKSSNPIMVEGVLFNPSMGKNDSDSDLASVERMIVRLQDRLKSAGKQAMRRGVTSQSATFVFILGTRKPGRLRITPNAPRVA